jgi:ABC-type multidrug transport system fused ATPase/permease subunit
LRDFLRAFAFVLRYRVWLGWCAVAVTAIGLLYSVGIGAMLPVLKIMISEEGLHGWVRQVRAESRLGVTLQRPQDRQGRWLAVLSVRPGAAAEGTLSPGDRIVAAGGVSVAEDSEGALAALTAPAEPHAVALSVEPAAGGPARGLAVPVGEEPWWSRQAGSAVAMLPEGGPDAKMRSLILVLAGLLALNFLSGAARFVQEYLVELIASRAVMDIRCTAFDRVVHGKLGGPDGVLTRGTNDVLGRFGREYEDIREGFTQVLGRLMREPIKMAAVIVFAFVLDWRLTLACVVAVPVAAGVIRKFGKKMTKAARRSLEAVGDMTGLVQQALLGLRVIKAYTSEGRERRRFLRANRTYVRHTMSFARVQALSGPLMEFLGASGAAVMAVLAAYLVFSGAMSREHFFAFLVCMVALADPARKLSGVSARVRKADAAAKRVFELIDRPTEERLKAEGGRLNEPAPPPGAETPQPPALGLQPSRAVGPLREALVFEGVGFRYGEGKEEALAGIDLTIRAGEIVAVVGPNGCGKTTLLSLVPRFLDPTRGRLLWDGTDLRAVAPAALRKRIGLVTQDAVIFKDSVHENIAYGEVGCPREAVVAAARRARADGFIETLRDSAGRTGYDAMLTELGQNLSGGQRQRIALARAMLREPSVLILDEATSQIDSESEALIQEALAGFAKGRTVLVIAHRLSTIQSADRIVVMDAGRIAADGRHAELLRSSPLYRRLCEGQFLADPDAAAASAAGPASPPVGNVA